MPEQPTGILPLERARFELRFPATDRSQDTRLLDVISSAVSQLSQDINVPLLDRFGELPFRLSDNQSLSLIDEHLDTLPGRPV